MDFFQGVDWGAYASFRFQANNLPTVASGMLVLHWIGLVGWVLLLASVGFAWKRSDLRPYATTLLLVALVGLACMMSVRWATDPSRPPDMGKAFPNLPAGAFSLCAIVAFSMLEGMNKASIWVLLGLAVLTCLVAFAELFLGFAFVSDVITALAGGVGFGFLARFLAGLARKPMGSSAAIALK